MGTPEPSEKRLSNGAVLRLMRGDITQVGTDAMANAANSGLRGGGGVDGAIHRAGGPSIMRELDAIRARQGGCPTGSAVATGAGQLPARWVFHAVGPVYAGGGSGEAAVLQSAYRACMDLARERKVERITFPSISTGVYGYPVEDAARLALATVRDELLCARQTVREAAFVLFDAVTLKAYQQVLSGLADSPAAPPHG
jgi:O-acetyl-ADP-ribose deacetylase (regulator of RNase III)